MLGLTLEFGPGLVQVCLSIVALATIIYNTKKTHETNNQLKPNGGSSALDKIIKKIDQLEKQISDKDKQDDE